ncbi:MAG: ParB/RepB/Spo0J family partition protein [Candidatus Bathyarchaeia archaeon]
MTEQILDLPLTCIIADSEQPRKYFDSQALEELADSIKQHGLLQPIQVRPLSEGKYVIVHGERRFRAHRIAHLLTIKCIVREMDEATAKDLQLIENLERNDLSDMELAKEFQRRIEKGQTHEEIAAVIKKSRAYVTQRLLLLKLPEETQTKLERKEITFANARILSNSIPQPIPTPQKCYAVTIEELEVYKLIQQSSKPDLKTLHEAYRKDLLTIRRALS